MELKVVFQYEKKEFKKGMRRAHFLVGSVTKGDLIIFPLTFILSFFIPYPIIQILVLLFGVIGLVALFIRLFLYPRKALKNNRGYQESYEIIFNEQGFLLSNENQHTKYSYKEFEKIVEDQDFIFFIDGDSVVFIPLRSLDVRDYKFIRDWILKNNKSIEKYNKKTAI